MFFSYYCLISKNFILLISIFSRYTVFSTGGGLFFYYEFKKNRKLCDQNQRAKIFLIFSIKLNIDKLLRALSNRN